MIKDMDRNEFLDWLDSYHAMTVEARAMQDRLRSLYDAARRVIGRISPDPKGCGVGREELLAQLADEERVLQERCEELTRRQLELERFIDSVEPGPFGVYQAILRLRYVECLKWPEVVDRLESYGLPYDGRYVFKLRNAALDAAWEKWQKDYMEGDRHE